MSMCPGEELKEKQAESREAQKEAREVARENQAVLRQVSQAESAIAAAEREVEQVRYSQGGKNRRSVHGTCIWLAQPSSARLAL